MRGMRKYKSAWRSVEVVEVDGEKYVLQEYTDLWVAGGKDCATLESFPGGRERLVPLKEIPELDDE